MNQSMIDNIRMRRYEDKDLAEQVAKYLNFRLLLAKPATVEKSGDFYLIDFGLCPNDYFVTLARISEIADCFERGWQAHKINAGGQS